MLYKGMDKTYILDAKELNDDIVSNMDDVMVFLKKHLRISYAITSLQRTNVLELPEAALREAVVNAVCHRDYFEKGARVMVEIYDDRVEIVSPGGVCKGITLENFGSISITRNSVLASMFYRIGYIEQMGTGIMRMKMATKEAKVAEGDFENQPPRVRDSIETGISSHVRFCNKRPERFLLVPPHCLKKKGTP